MTGGRARDIGSIDPATDATDATGLTDAPAAGRADEPPALLRQVLVVGTGLLGTSVALAATGAGITVWLTDRDPAHLEVAVERGAGAAWPDEMTTVDHVVLCVPPSAVAVEAVRLQRLGVCRGMSDVSGVKANVLAEIETLGGDISGFVGGHPMAGGERGGPWVARGDLFQGRPWVLTPTAATRPEVLAQASELARRCGADVLLRSPEAHDRAVAAVSHLPQIVASALAARLCDLPAEDLDLAGQGLRDMTRIADSDPELWAELLVGNAPAVAPVLDAVISDLSRMAAALRPVGGASDAAPVTDVVARGNAGRRRLPGKHGGAVQAVVPVFVAVPDRPGELARLLAAVGDARVNVEDLRVDHVPGHPVGVAELTVAPADAERAVVALRREGWTASSPATPPS